MLILTNDKVVETLIFEKFDNLFVNGTKAGVIAILISIVIISIIKKVSTSIIHKTNWKQKEMIIKIKNVILSVLLLISILYQFSFMENLMTTLLASGGILAVVIGLASQEAASNIVAGMMILISKPFNIGDTIILKNQGLRGTVIDINMNHTVIETVDKNPIMIPNTVMNKEVIENITQETEYKFIYLYFDISYESDINQAIEIIKNEVERHPLFFDVTVNPEDEKVPVHCMEFKDSSISLRAKVTTRNAADGFQLSSDCRISIKKAFDENGIEIPYPHMQIINEK